MNQDQKIQELEAKLQEKEQDINELADFIFKTFRAMGVKSFEDLDKVGNTVLKEVPKIMMESTIARHKLQARFAHFNDASGLLDKYKHLIPKG